MASSPETAPSPPSPDSDSPNSTRAPPPTHSSPPPSPPASPPPESPPPSPPQSPLPSSPPPSSPPPDSTTPPPKESPSKSPSPPPPEDSKSPDSKPSSPPPSSGSPPASPPPPSASPSPPAPANAPPTPIPVPPNNGSQPAPIFTPPPPGAISTQSPPPPSGKISPPPPTSRASPEQKSPGSSSPGDSSSSSDSANTVIIAGIVVGGIVVLALVIVCLLCAKKKKKQPYYIDPGRPHKGGDPYYNGSTQWNSPQPLDHIVKLPPPPGVMGTPLGGGGSWGAPPPPLAAHTSSEFSSGFSGQHNGSMPPPSPNMGGIGGFSKSQFTYEELAAATGGFSQVNLLGQGGFGYVHKGVLPDGREVAVKSLKSGSGQGEREFQAEVEIISRVHHRHLVSLVGYCIAEGQRMLVYEFVSNKTLEFHLYGKGQPVMDWSCRLRIALGSAKGLAYLHEDCHPRIIHRDIKAANILLDDKYEAMVADFGLAKLSSDNYTHVSTRVMGTFGYLAPEYASSGKLTEKSDVFSFGVMLLELITGRKPVDPTSKFMEDSLVDWARPILSKALEDGNYDELVDPGLEGHYTAHEMARMIACASASIRHSARRRPKMSQIVRALEGDSSLEDLNDGPKHGQSSAFPANGGTETQTYDTGMYNADMMKFRKMVMSTQDFGGSSEYGGTSEYGLNPSTSSSDDFGHSGHQNRKP